MSAIKQITTSDGVTHDIQDSRVQTATANAKGMVKPDGTTITIDNDGTIHSAANPFGVDTDGYITFNY